MTLILLAPGTVDPPLPGRSVITSRGEARMRRRTALGGRSHPWTALGVECERGGMFQPQNLARTARVTNAMVWFGLAVFFLGFAGEHTSAAFTAGGGVLVGWVIVLAAAVLMVTLGTIEAVRLRLLARGAGN
jgi:hypothetical protein